MIKPMLPKRKVVSANNLSRPADAKVQCDTQIKGLIFQVGFEVASLSKVASRSLAPGLVT